MMKRVFLLALVVGLFSGVFAQSGITGIVWSENEQPLEGVNVRVKNSPQGSVTTEDGAFELKKIKGTVEQQFSRLGFQPQTKRVSADDSPIKIVMAVATIVYDDFDVTATRAGDNAPFAINNITAEELKTRNGGAELPELLKLSPSIVTSTENGLPFGNTKFRIRGSDPSRINVTVDGIPLNDAESQTVFWVNMTDITESVSDIQIQRGVGASTNGAASFGASVNIQTKGYDAHPYAEFSSYAGSYNTFKNSVQANTGLIKDHFVFNARLSALSSDGYVDHTGMDHKSYFFSGGYFSDKTTLRVKVFGNEEHTGISWWGVTADSMKVNRKYNTAGDYFDKDGQRKYYDKQQDNYWQNHIHAHFSHKFSEELRLKAAFHYTHGEGYYEQIQDKGNWLNGHDTDYEYYGFPNAIFIKPESGDTIDGSDLARQKWLKNDFYGGTFSLEYNVKDLQLVFGA
ncbi:MAG: TonB-dependent receptor plug domain-containing protein, partial [Bacteroidales bacterium]|nr:TonB-dependent receptor plug domain-containing protein [Bacteroidales bacterium]